METKYGVLNDNIPSPLNTKLILCLRTPIGEKTLNTDVDCKSPALKQKKKD